MQAIISVTIICLVTLTQARPQPPPGFVFWNYFPFFQQQPIKMMQQRHMPLMYPRFERFFNGPFPINNNMPIIGEVQFNLPVPPAELSKTTQRPTSTTTTTTRHPRPPTTTTTTPYPRPPTTTTTTPHPRPPTTTTSTTTPAPSTRPTKRQTSVKNSTPSVAAALKSQLSKGIFEMARNILSKASHQQTGKFNVFSPINVAAVLSLLELGAKGQTNQEMQQILGFDKLQSSEHPLGPHHALGQLFESVLHPETVTEKGAQINMANGIFMQTGYSMRPDYRTSVETIYQSQVTALDFQQQPTIATKFINDWVRQQTNGKIENILTDGIDSNTRMIVASAVSFKALWKSSFIPAATSKRPFYPNGKQGQKIMVDTMANGGDFKYYESNDYDCAIMALPFKGETTVMYIILPNESNPDKLRKLQATLTSDIIEDMISKMQIRSSLITMPKMHLSDTIDLKDILSQLNVRSAFDGARSDFSGITENNHLALDEFKHKIDLTISETGTEGAAATVSSISRQDFDVEFRVDTPFMFFVRHDQTKLPIFYGTVIEPVNSV